MGTLQDTFKLARRAARSLNRRSEEEINQLLKSLADALEQAIPEILEANALDLARMEPSNPKYDRLQLTDARLRDIASDMRSVASLPSPLGKTLSEVTRPNGMTIKKVSVPFGVIGVIYEARPNVTFDVFSLCVKAGSACLLKGGTDARDTNECAVKLIRSVLTAHGWDENTVTLLPASHDATAEMLNAVGYVDLIIPRGSKGLIDYVRNNSRVPVIETGAGVCHTYIHSAARIDHIGPQLEKLLGVDGGAVDEACLGVQNFGVELAQQAVFGGVHAGAGHAHDLVGGVKKYGKDAGQGQNVADHDALDLFGKLHGEARLVGDGALVFLRRGCGAAGGQQQGQRQ